MCHYICENYFFYEISFSKLCSFWFQVLELVSCNCKQCDDDCLFSSHRLICADACSCKHCKNSVEEADDEEYFDNCSGSENDSESNSEYQFDKCIDRVDCKYYQVTLFSCFLRWQVNFKKTKLTPKKKIFHRFLLELLH